MSAANAALNEPKTRKRGKGVADKGMNWIRQTSRLSLYLRDGLACAYCGQGVERGAKLTLDHLIPHVQGGTNHPGNLVTACHIHNSIRRDLPLAEFCEDVASEQIGSPSASQILARIQEFIARPLAPFRAQAKALISLRGSCARALFPK